MTTKKRLAIFGPAKMTPIAETLPASMAASIGRTIARHSYLDWLLAHTIYDVLGISIKQGRTAMRLPQASRYVRTIEDLMMFHGMLVNIGGTFAKQLDAADRARNELAHSLYVRDEHGKIHIQLVSGSWAMDQDVVPVRRPMTPQTQSVDRAFLTSKRKAVETAIKATKHVRAEILRALRASNERRRTQPGWDRRSLTQT